jgi:hypothetical protein
LAAVVELKNTAAEGEDCVRVFQNGRIQQQFAGHSEVYDKESRGFEAEDNELSVPLQRFDLSRAEERDSGIRIAAQNSLLAELHVQNLAPHDGGEASHDCFYFG